MDYSKYKKFPKIQNPNREWPEKTIDAAPIWCSVDLRDGNQALVNPMTLSQKLGFFKFLVGIGFKEIEVGFPAASDTEFLFTRTLIEQKLIPDDVTIQVLTQSREHIIEKTFEALEGVKKAIVHLYNSTSALQRDVVFGKNKEEITEIAVSGARLIKKFAEARGPERFWFEYSPESFTGTETDYAVEICDAVADVFKPSPERKLILNLPSTVELATPNVYADQIEYVSKRVKNRESIIVSLHTHNDRGTGVASSELGLLAGGERVEGTLFGNGERTGNADILNLALNIYTQGVDPKLDFSNVDAIIKIYEESTGLAVHPRHPYAGDLVFTAFSGSHQDAIKKGMARIKNGFKNWEVPYLPIDPADLGKSYDPIIRINSQSGKSGVSYILETHYGMILPKAMQIDFGTIATSASDKSGKELSPEEIFSLFERNYYVKTPIELKWYNEYYTGRNESQIKTDLIINGEAKTISGAGNGIIDSYSRAIKEELKLEFEILNYNEHSLDFGTKSRAITYMQIQDANGVAYFGAGLSTNVSKSSLRSLTSAINKMLAKKTSN
jgi:2-isopropylmalate synthase